MKQKYAFHPNNYNISGNEKYYSDMAAKGWFLTKRGAYLSRFQKAAPENISYRIALYNPEIDDFGQELADKHIFRNKDNGWNYVTGKGFFHIFSSSENSNPSEFYYDPERQISVFKKQRRGIIIIWLLITLQFLHLYFRTTLFGNREISFDYIGLSFIRLAIETTALFSFITIFYLIIIHHLIYVTYATTYHIHKLKNGFSLNSGTKRYHFIFKIIKNIAIVICAASLILSIDQWAQNEKYDVSSKSDSTYLLLEDLGIRGEHSNFWDFENKVKIEHSLLTRHSRINESVDIGEESYLLIEEVYEMKSAQLAKAFIPVLKSMDFFDNPNPEYQKVTVEGLDYAAKNGKDYIAVKDNLAYFIFADGDQSDSDVNESDEGKNQIDVLKALAKKLN